MLHCRRRRLLPLPGRSGAGQHQQRGEAPARHQQHLNNTLNEKNIAEKGFSKYVKTEDGKYEKAAGPAEAPATLDRGTMAENLKHLD